MVVVGEDAVDDWGTERVGGEGGLNDAAGRELCRYGSMVRCSLGFSDVEEGCLCGGRSIEELGLLKESSMEARRVMAEAARDTDPKKLLVGDCVVGVADDGDGLFSDFADTFLGRGVFSDILGR